MSWDRGIEPPALPCSGPRAHIPKQNPIVTPDDATAYDQSIILARFLAEFGVRNTVLENFHAGRVPHSETGDFSDVAVVTPDAQIPWNKLSRLSDPEMRALMLDIEESLARACFAILLAEREGYLEKLLQGIRERSFGEHGISWDIPDAKWQERQSIWKKNRADTEGRQRLIQHSEMDS